MQRISFALSLTLAVALWLLIYAGLHSQGAAAQSADPMLASVEAPAGHTGHPAAHHSAGGATINGAIDPAVLAASDVIVELSGFTLPSPGCGAMAFTTSPPTTAAIAAATSAATGRPSATPSPQ